MTTPASLVNLALQSYGDRTTITAAQLLAGANNQAKQANLTFANTRDSLLRMAPWDCAMKTANLTYITSATGTPENTSPAATLWSPGTPRPPWIYEYQYPVDCLRACFIIPATQTGFSGVPITNAVTGGAPNLWTGGPIPFKVATDEFWGVIGATVVLGGSGYDVGNEITLAGGATSDPPIGASPVLRVITAPAGIITSVAVLQQVPDSDPATGGSYFNLYNRGQIFTQGSIIGGTGSGATFTLTQSQKSDQRVILTNQEYATMVYVKQVLDPNVWDPLFQDAFVNALGADICLAMSGDKGLANICIARANRSILEARTADSNEDLTINDRTPDWIRTRGYATADNMIAGPGFQWGDLLQTF